MDLTVDILAKMLSEHKVKVVFENLKLDTTNKIVEQISYKTILRIRNILDNDSLDDFECIERIVLLLEDMGIGGGSRHDFG